MYGRQKGKILSQPFTSTGVAINVSQMVSRRPEADRRNEKSDRESSRRNEEGRVEGILQVCSPRESEILLGTAVCKEQAEGESKEAGIHREEPVEIKEGNLSMEFQDAFIRKKRLEEAVMERWEI
jgi:hypothetical protein